MNKIIVLVVVIAIFGGAWFWGVNRRSLLEDEGIVFEAKMGRVQLPISASGEAREHQRVEIKTEAGGAIDRIAVDEGDVVQPGQLLLEIDPEEEQRNVDRAQSAVDTAEANLELAKNANEQALHDLTANVETAQTVLDVAQARYDYAHKDFEFRRGIQESSADAVGILEMQRSLTEYLSAKAELKKAEIALDRAKSDGPRNVRRSEAELARARAQLKSAQDSLADANRRLNKTKVINNYKSPCRVVRIHVTEGMVVSSAVTTIGSSALMELADLTDIEVTARVDETDIATVDKLLLDGTRQRDAGPPPSGPEGREPRYSDEVIVKFDALRDKEFIGRIIDIAEKPDSRAQIITYDVRIRLEQVEALEQVRIGMQGTVEFEPMSEEGVVVPYEAIHRVERDRFVVKMPNPADPTGKPLDRPVEVGLTDGRRVVILEGLEEGDKVYTKLPLRIPRASAN